MERRVEWRDGQLVERLSKQRSLMLDDADDLIRNAANTELAPDGIQIREEKVRDLVADDDDRRAELVFLRHDRSPGLEIVFLDREILAVDRMNLDALRPGVWR